MTDKRINERYALDITRIERFTCIGEARTNHFVEHRSFVDCPMEYWPIVMTDGLGQLINECTIILKH